MHRSTQQAHPKTTKDETRDLGKPAALISNPNIDPFLDAHGHLDEPQSAGADVVALNGVPARKENETKSHEQAQHRGAVTMSWRLCKHAQCITVRPMSSLRFT